MRKIKKKILFDNRASENVSRILDKFLPRSWEFRFFFYSHQNLVGLEPATLSAKLYQSTRTCGLTYWAKDDTQLNLLPSQ